MWMAALCYFMAYSRKSGYVCNFWEKGQKMLKKDNIFENLGKNIQNLKIFWKKAGDCMQILHCVQ